MGVYDLEEQEQLDDLKAWWSRWGNTISGVVIAVCVAIIGVQGWRWWQNSKADEASVLYGAVSTAVQANDVAKSRDAMNQLVDKFGGTAYAPRAALLYAKLLWDTGDKAGAKLQLTWVIDKAAEDELRQVARYRLAQALLDEKQYDQALATLDAKHADSFAGLYADLRGDVLASAGRNADARGAYEAALAKFDAKSPYRNYLQVKLDALGGPAAGPGALPPTAVAPTAPAAPAPAAPAPTTANPKP
jgi:predicted negative regulator of RcsB-dependent stress response